MALQAKEATRALRLYARSVHIWMPAICPVQDTPRFRAARCAAIAADGLMPAFHSSIAQKDACPIPRPADALSMRDVAQRRRLKRDMLIDAMPPRHYAAAVLAWQRLQIISGRVYTAREERYSNIFRRERAAYGADKPIIPEMIHCSRT